MAKLAILIMGRDQTVKLCELSADFFRKNWSQCPYPLILATQTKAPQGPHYDRIIYTSEDAIWGERLDIALQAIEADYILLSQEDFFVSSKINEKNIRKCLTKLKDPSIAAIRLIPTTLFVKRYNSEYTCLPKGKPYRIAGQPTIFKKGYLQQLAAQHYNPWQFEIDGTEYSNCLPGEVLVCRSKVYPCVHAWGKGSWTREAIALFKRDKMDPEIYCHDAVYPLKQYFVDNLWLFGMRLFPAFFVNYSKKKNRKD